MLEERSLCTRVLPYSPAISAGLCLRCIKIAEEPVITRLILFFDELDTAVLRAAPGRVIRRDRLISAEAVRV